MGEEPRPASLEKTPLAIPVRKVLLRPYPTAPPTIGLMPNADDRISFRHGRMFSRLMITVSMSAKINTAETAGISFSVNEAIRFIPPMIIIPDIAAVTIPAASGAMFPL